MHTYEVHIVHRHDRSPPSFCLVVPTILRFNISMAWSLFFKHKTFKKTTRALIGMAWSLTDSIRSSNLHHPLLFFLDNCGKTMFKGVTLSSGRPNISRHKWELILLICSVTIPNGKKSVTEINNSHQLKIVSSIFSFLFLNYLLFPWHSFSFAKTGSVLTCYLSRVFRMLSFSLRILI